MTQLGLNASEPDERDAGRALPAARPLTWSLALILLALWAPVALAQDSVDTGGGDPTGGDGTVDGGTGGPTAEAGRITINADRMRIRLGQAVTFSGRREPAGSGARVLLEFKRPGGTFRTVAETRTDARGRYSVNAVPRRNGRFVVTTPRSSGKALRSRGVDVGVHARVGISGRSHQLRARGLRVRGKVRPTESGRRVVLERLTGKGWQRLKATKTRARGVYRFRWSPPSLGGYKLRARFGGDGLNRGARGTLRGRVHVYREDHASYYGPGFYGNTTACGQTLRQGTVGVAHKRIRCGAMIRFHYRGTTRRIQVIDRGPFIAGRRWDLTDAARKKLGFPRGTDDIWANR